MMSCALITASPCPSEDGTQRAFGANGVLPAARGDGHGGAGRHVVDGNGKRNRNRNKAGMKEKWK